MKRKMEKTIEQLQSRLEKNYRRLFIIICIGLVLFIALVIQAIKQ